MEGSSTWPPVNQMNSDYIIQVYDMNQRGLLIQNLYREPRLMLLSPRWDRLPRGYSPIIEAIPLTLELVGCRDNITDSVPSPTGPSTFQFPLVSCRTEMVSLIVSVIDK
jgi:hypothetical protein